MNNNIKVDSFIKSGMSVDVEDAINIGMKKYFNIEIPPTRNVVDNVLRLLNLFSEKKTSATFFLLGEVADKYPTLVKKIAKDGHEIGVHGINILGLIIFHLRQQKMR
ncbi:MAG: polysaccharide deacetylase family protein [Bacteroidales bacterium]|nr:polysaccharide deacetylase family protein [Bacteroidales bacterium]